MHGRRQEFNIQLHQVFDSLVMIVAFLAAHTLRDNLTDVFGLLPIRPFREFLWVVAILVPFTPIVLELNGYYKHPLQKTLGQSLRQMLQTLLWMSVIIGGCVIFFKWIADSRAVLLLTISFASILLLTKEWLIKRWLKRRIHRGEMRVRTVLAGAQEDIDAVWSELPEFARQQMHVVARIDLKRQPAEKLAELFKQENVERVVLAAEHIRFHRVEQAVRACEKEGVEAWLSTEFLRTEHARPRFDMLGDQPMLVFRMTPEDYWSLLAKEVIDRVGALAILLLSSPFWLVAWIGIKLSSPGPAIFRQERGGRYGKPFKMYKFRTMVMDADSEEMRAKVEAANEQNGPTFKLTDDPRVFKFGRFLRKTSIDELPQLLNILRGEMSLVGPRPLPVYQVEKIEQSEHRRRLSVKPGLTCLWQVSGRSQITEFEQWVELDLRYIDEWSLWLDLKILFRTIPVVLWGAGAR